MGLFDIPYITKQGRAEQKLAQMIENRWAAERADDYERDAAISMRTMAEMQREIIDTKTELECLQAKPYKTKEDKKRIRQLKILYRSAKMTDRLSRVCYNMDTCLAQEERRNSRQRNWYNPF
jgi:hypothetical protein